MCDTFKGCPDDKAWAITKDERLYRITFSRSLAEHAIDRAGTDYRLARIKIRIGRELSRGETSRTGLYAIRSRRKDKTLRISLSRDIAELLCDYESRYVTEAYIENLQWSDDTPFGHAA